MIDFLRSVPPHTLGVVSPASRATSTKVTGELGGDFFAACRIVALHLPKGVVNASRRELPSTTREEPRNRRRGKFMGYRAGTFGKSRGTIPAPSFTATIRSVGTLVKRSTCPLGHVISRESIFVRFPKPK